MANRVDAGSATLTAGIRRSVITCRPRITESVRHALLPLLGPIYGSRLHHACLRPEFHSRTSRHAGDASRLTGFAAYWRSSTWRRGRWVELPTPVTQFGLVSRSEATGRCCQPTAPEYSRLAMPGLDYKQNPADVIRFDRRRYFVLQLLRQ